MLKRLLLVSTSLAVVTLIGTAAVAVHEGRVRAELLEEARARLQADLENAPELDRVQASTALSLLDRAIARGADDPETAGLAHYAHALVYLAAGDLVFADGELTAARGELGWTADLRVLAGAIARARTEMEQARIHASQALAADPDHPRALQLAGDLALDRRDGEVARRSFEHLVEVAPTATVAHNRLGLALELEGALSEAQASYREAVRLDRRNHDAWINLGRLAAATGDLPGAREAFDHAVEHAPSAADAWLGRGLARMGTSDLAEAERSFHRAAELAPNDAEPLLALGDLLRQQGRVAEAVTVYREALAIEDADAASWLKLGHVLFASGDLEGARAAYEASIARAPSLAAAHNGLGAALMHLGDHHGAELALERAAALDALDPNPLLNLGLLHERRGELAEARRAFERALERDPTSDVAFDRLAAR